MEEIKEFFDMYKKFILFIIGVSLIISVGVWFVTSTKKAVHLDDAVIVYEEYQEIYNTCVKINTDICIYKDINESDKMFEQFSKTQLITTKKTQLNKWVEEYNAKSKMYGKAIWKSSELPYQLNVNQFNCY